ncbi:hypothetical protein C8Q70DRAFT_465547 [Cubamyces menziesii]|nr:hypothetical protein C8Q70DRAFT_465547 [Cubamyces menziesii]
MLNLTLTMTWTRQLWPAASTASMSSSYSPHIQQRSMTVVGDTAPMDVPESRPCSMAARRLLGVASGTATATATASGVGAALSRDRSALRPRTSNRCARAACRPSLRLPFPLCAPMPMSTMRALMHDAPPALFLPLPTRKPPSGLVFLARAAAPRQTRTLVGSVPLHGPDHRLSGRIVVVRSQARAARLGTGTCSPIYGTPLCLLGLRLVEWLPPLSFFAPCLCGSKLALRCSACCALLARASCGPICDLSVVHVFLLGIQYGGPACTVSGTFEVVPCRLLDTPTALYKRLASASDTRCPSPLLQPVLILIMHMHICTRASCPSPYHYIAESHPRTLEYRRDAHAARWLPRSRTYIAIV